MEQNLRDRRRKRKNFCYSRSTKEKEKNSKSFGDRSGGRGSLRKRDLYINGIGHPRVKQGERGEKKRGRFPTEGGLETPLYPVQQKVKRSGTRIQKKAGCRQAVLSWRGTLMSPLPRKRGERGRVLVTKRGVWGSWERVRLYRRGELSGGGIHTTHHSKTKKGLRTCGSGLWGGRKRGTEVLQRVRRSRPNGRKIQVTTIDQVRNQ